MTGWSYTSRKKNVGTWKQFLWTESSFLTLGSNFYLPAKQPAVLFAGSQRLTRDGFTLSPIPLVEKKKKGKSGPRAVGDSHSALERGVSREATRFSSRVYATKSSKQAGTWWRSGVGSASAAGVPRGVQWWLGWVAICMRSHLAYVR